MSNTDFIQLANSLLKKHNMYNWKCVINEKTHDWLAICRHSNKRIELTLNLCSNFESSYVEDVILHEIAHAMVGYDAAHGPVWRKKAEQLGCKETL